MGNMIAFVALLAWPVVTLVLFLAMSTQRAIVASLLGGYLLLPYIVGFDFKGVPTLDKTSIPNIATFLLAIGLARSGTFRWPRSILVNLLMIGYVICPILTTYANPDAVTIGSIRLPGLTLYDALSSTAQHAIQLMPFIVGAGLMRSDAAHRDILLLFVIAALAYTVPVLLEVVKGPYFQAVIYHVDPREFYEQQIRYGGFRAMVFLGHGLAVSSFYALALLSAVGLWRGKGRVLGLPALLCAFWLFVILVLNKSAGALVIGTMIAILLAAFRPRRFASIALLFAMMIMTYPTLRANALIPINTIESVASAFSSDRANSLDYRLRNEDILLTRARERPWFGWGGYGRNRVFVVTDWGSTVDVSVTDGAWIIALGSNGWLGYISLFGLLSYPLLHLFRMRRQAISPATVALAAMLLYSLLDLIPNAALPPITWLICGALAGLPRLRQTHRLPAGAPARPAPAITQAISPA